jgi:Phage tail assembly chaperone proteins, E, or 41 or 14
MNDQTMPPRGGTTAAPAEPKDVPRVSIAQDPEQTRPVDTMPTEITVKLSRPIVTHLSPKTEALTFREPTAMDIDAVGNPVSNDFRNGWPPLPVIDSKKMTMMMARLASISPKGILEMTARDWSTCSLAVQVFFLPDLGNL